MRFRRVDEQTVAISGINLLLCELLQQIPLSADPDDDPAVEARLYSPPAGEEEQEFTADWQAYVQPGLKEHFQSSLEVVRNDLADFPPDTPTPTQEYTLHIPVRNLEAWLNALNQARLALAARHEVTEADMDDVPKEGDTRALAIFQIYVYGVLQEWIIRELNP